MKAKNAWTIFVTVGFPDKPHPIQNKVMIEVDEETNQTPIQAAKLHRKSIADNLKQYRSDIGRVRPSDLYYEIYIKADSRFPFAESTNSPHLYIPGTLDEMLENLNRVTKAVVDSIDPIDTAIEDLNNFTKTIAEDPYRDSLLVKMWEEEMEPKVEIIDENGWVDVREQLVSKARSTIKEGLDQAVLESTQEYNPMDELLKEMQKETPDEDVINGLACSLFITSGGGINLAQVNEFEKYAPCKIYPVEKDSFGWLIGGIDYNDKNFTFG